MTTEAYDQYAPQYGLALPIRSSATMSARNAT
jgi:hypothetical protein